jgi:flagellin-like hook-associated protein FlgL
VPGSDVFGGLSGEVRGNVDLDPRLTSDTLLSSINGGAGIGTNAAISISFANGGLTTTRIVDLSGAATIGDVARLIEANPPTGANLTVDINDQNGLTVRTGVGTIRISEVAAGRTAKELGIFTSNSAVPAASIIGTDLNAVVLKTTQLTNLLGTKAQGRLITAGSNNNDIVLTAAQNGSDFEDVTVIFQPGGTAGSEDVNYDDFTKTLTVTIADGSSTAKQVAAAITNQGTFTAVADYRDATSTTQAGSNAVSVVNFGVVTTGGSGEDLDIASGLVLTNGGTTVTLDISEAETVEDLLNLINGAGVGLLAEINAAGNGIDVRSTLSGADFAIGENGGTTATQLGIRTYTGATPLAALNRGLGVPTNDTLGVLDTSQLDTFEIVARDGTTLSIDLSTATSLNDVVSLINTAPGNPGVTASLTTNGNGIALVDSSLPDNTGQLVVRTVVGNVAAEYLGFVPAGETEIISTTVDGGGNFLLDGNDVVKNELLIQASDGAQFWVDLTGATTVQDVIGRVNDAAAEAGVAITAGLATTGNGIELVDATGGGGTLNVQAVEGSQAAEYLGFLPNGPVSIVGTDQVLVSEDRHTLEVDSVFNSLVRLRTALENNDVAELGRALERLDVDLTRVNFARAEIGSRLQSLDIIKTRLEDENVQLQSALSNEIDVDLVEAISNLTARQYALQASLQTAANILNLSILDYI